jgi:hypothetical protein
MHSERYTRVELETGHRERQRQRERDCGVMMI